MRQKLNNNPTAQAALVGVLLIATAFLVISQMGGGSSTPATSTIPTTDPAATATTDPALATTPGAVPATAATTDPAVTAAASGVPLPPLPPEVSSAYEASETVVLLVVRRGGIDDRLVINSVSRLEAIRGLAVFVVPAEQIARYAAITLGARVDRVPALVVLRPRRLSGGTPQATVSYGFQSTQSVVQAVIDASYDGPTETYHPN